MFMEKFNPLPEQLQQEVLREKYDVKNNREVRAIRKEIILEQKPDIIQELGDEEWIKYLYSTPMPDELPRFKEYLLKKLEKTKNSSVDSNPTFDPAKGEFSSGFSTESEKNGAIMSIEKDIHEIELLMSESNQ